MSLKSQPQFTPLQFSLKAWFFCLTLFAVLVAIAINFRSVSCALKFGRPLDLNAIQIVDYRSGDLILGIDDEYASVAVSESDSHIDINIFFAGLNDPSLLQELGLNGAWQSLLSPDDLTLRFGDEYFHTTKTTESAG